MTMRTKNRELRHTDTLDISPEDAARLGLRDGENVRVTSRQGAVEMPLHIDPRVKEGELFATFHAGETAVNRLTGQGRDKQAMTPEYKVVAVRLEKNGGAAAHG
jgi:formate dehydrogenase major subunit